MIPTNPLIDSNVRTNITPDSYSYGGNTYKKEVRIDGQGNSYTVDIAQPQAATTPAASTPAPAAGPIENPTIGSVYGSSNAGEYNSTSNEYESYLKDPTTFLASKGLSETDVRNKSLAAMQAQIDATNSYYSTKLNEARRQGQGRLGSSTAIQARRGLLGSDFGGALTDETNNANTQIYNSIEEERNAKVQALLSEAKTNAEDRYTKEREAIEGGLKSRLEYIKGKEERNKTQSQAAVNALIAQGIDPATLDEATLGKIAEGYGVKGADLTTTYKSTKYASDKAAKDEETKRKNELADKVSFEKTKAELEASKPVNLSEGGVLVDPKTGKVVYKNPKTFAPKDGDTTGAAVSPATTSTNLKNLIGTSQKAIDLSNAAGPNWFTKTGGDIFKGDSEFRQLEALTDAVRTNLLTLNTDPAIKKFFGPQMSNADVTLMTSAATPLNVQKMTPTQVKDYITQAQDVFVRAKKAVDAANGISEAPAAKMVTVQLPDGRTGSIPEANVQAAVAKGAKVIQ